MEFRVGDNVVHSTYGLGQIHSVVTQQNNGTPAGRYYEIVTRDATIWVPVDRKASGTLRRVTPRRDLEECRKTLSGRPLPLNKDYQKRRLDLDLRLKSGLLRDRCEVVRDLTAHSRRRPLGEVEARLLDRLYKILCEEWAAAAGVTSATASAEIDGLLAKHAGLPTD